MDYRYDISYGINETFDDKIKRLESLPMESISDNILYHGLRFNGVDKFESILKSGFILCGRVVPKSFRSFDGNNKSIILDYHDIENCNNGDYISVMPFGDNIEYQTFIRENIFLKLSSDIEAICPYYLKYDDYIRLRKSGIQTKNLYSYALHEYMIKESIPIDKILSIGIDTDYFTGDLDKTIKQLEKIKRYYNASIPINIRGSRKQK